MLGGFLTFSTLYALPSPEQIIQIQKSFESKNKLEKSKYLTTIFDLSTNLKNAGREKEYESLILQLANEKFYKSISPAIKIHLKYENLKEAENLNIYKHPEHSYILGKYYLTPSNKHSNQEKGFKYLMYAASKKHTDAINILKENKKTIKELKLKNLEKQKIKMTVKTKKLNLNQYYKIYNTYPDVDYIFKILNSIKNSKNDSIVPKNRIITDLKNLSNLHYTENFKPDKKIEKINKFFNINRSKIYK